MKKPIKKKSNGKDKTPPEPLKLNIGCGRTAQVGYKGVDIIPGPGVDYVLNILKTPWPFKDESVDDIICLHTFEHFDGAERVTIMKEIWRVLKMGARVDFVVPYWSSQRSIQDPTHKWPPLGENSFLYFNTEWCRLNGVEHVGGLEPRYNFTHVYGLQTRPEWDAKNTETRTFACAHYTNVAEDLNMRLIKIPLLPPMPRKIRYRQEGGAVCEWQDAK